MVADSFMQIGKTCIPKYLYIYFKILLVIKLLCWQIKNEFFFKKVLPQVKASI